MNRYDHGQVRSWTGTFMYRYVHVQVGSCTGIVMYRFVHVQEILSSAHLWYLNAITLYVDVKAYEFTCTHPVLMTFKIAPLTDWNFPLIFRRRLWEKGSQSFPFSVLEKVPFPRVELFSSLKNVKNHYFPFSAMEKVPLPRLELFSGLKNVKQQYG